MAYILLDMILDLYLYDHWIRGVKLYQPSLYSKLIVKGLFFGQIEFLGLQFGN
jgi:hypothetical protein